MATQPFTTTCIGCRVPLAPGAKFCGSCGQPSVGGTQPAPPRPPQPPAPSPVWGGAPGAGFDAVMFAGPVDQAMPRVGAALAQVGVQEQTQTMGGIRFQRGGPGARLVGEAMVRPDGHGNTAVSVNVQVDQGNFILVYGVCSGFGFVMALILFSALFVIAIVIVGGIVGVAYARLATERSKVQERVMASLRHAAATPSAAPPPFTPPPVASPPFAPPAAASASPLEQLRDLAEQRDQGVLTSEEFEAAKTLILGRL